MLTVNLYMENAGKAPKKKEEWFGYILTYQGKKLHKEAEYGTYDGSRHRRETYMFLHAIRRCRNCEIIVHTDAPYIRRIFQSLPAYAEKNWEIYSGQELKHADLWKEIYKESQDKKISFVFGRHEYTDKLKRGIREKRHEKESDS